MIYYEALQDLNDRFQLLHIDTGDVCLLIDSQEYADSSEYLANLQYLLEDGQVDSGEVEALRKFIVDKGMDFMEGITIITALLTTAKEKNWL